MSSMTTTAAILFAGSLACGAAAVSIALAAPASAPDAEYLYQLGLSFYRMQQPVNAIAAFTSAIAAKPDFAEAYANRGENFQNLKQYGMAIEDYNAALQIRPNYQMAINDRGSAEYIL